MKKRSAGLEIATMKTKRSAAPSILPRWRWHYRTLRALQRRLQQESATERAAVAEAIEPHSSHAADSATDEFEHDVALALLSREENALRDVSDALQRITEGRYGICEATGARISAARLRALPWCRYTVEAERRFERSKHAIRARVPEAGSLRGQRRDIPETGTITRNNSEGPAEDVSPKAADSIAAEASADESPEAEEPA